MRIIISLFILLAYTAAAWALPVTPDKAKQWALDFFESKSQSRSGNVSLNMVWDGEDNLSRSSGDPAFYVFNRTDTKGFVVVAGDDVVNPLIGYSFENNFNANNLPDNIRAWFEDTKNEIAAIRRNPSRKAMDKAWQSTTSIGNKVLEKPTALWNQDYPYNLECPVDPSNGKRSVTGCTATALAIVMRGHQWPVMGSGSLPSYSYKDANGNNAFMKPRSVARKYDWENMPEVVDNSITESQKMEIAKLMMDCGQAVQSSYSNNATGGVARFALSPLVNNFSYSDDIQMVERHGYTTSEWEELMKKELQGNGQVLYCGFSTSSGHAFVLYGYTSTNYFAVNWGWGGYCNGYFKLTQLTPDDQGIGGSEDPSGFNHYQNAIINMRRKVADYTDLSLFTFFGVEKGAFQNSWGIKTTKEVIQGSVDVATIFVINYSFRAYSGLFGYCLFDKDGNFKQNVGTRYRIEDLNTNYFVTLSEEILHLPETVQKGDYIAMGEMKDGASTYTPIKPSLNSVGRLEVGSCDHALKDDIFSLSDGSQNLESDLGVEALTNDFAKGASFTVNVRRLMNISATEQSGMINIGHFSDKHELKSKISSTVNVDKLAAGDGLSNLAFNCTLTDDVRPGDYLAVCSSVDEGNTWTRVRSLDYLKARVEMLTTDDALVKGTTIEYDKATGNITVDNKLADEYYVLVDGEGKTVMEASGEKPFVIDTNKIKAARYTLWISLTKNAKEKTKIDLMCGKF